MLWGALAANAPDADAVLNFFVSDIDSLVLHRGLSHSIFTALLLSPFLGWLLWKMHKQQGKLASWIILITTNVLLHDFLDTCNVYGTGLFTPFTDHRFSFNNIFVADPVFTLPLLISCIALLIVKRDSMKRQKWIVSGLIISAVYMSVTFYNHSKAVKALHVSMNEKGIVSDEFFATPTLVNSLLWNVVVKDSSGFWIGYYSVFDNDPSPDLNFIPQNKNLLDDLDDAVEVEKLMTFTNGYYCITDSLGKLWFNDIRFGQVGGWEDPDAIFGLSFDLSKNADNTMVVQKGRLEGSRKEMLESMWSRIKGI